MTVRNALARGLGVSMVVLVGLTGCSQPEGRTEPTVPPPQAPPQTPPPVSPPTGISGTTLSGTAYEFSDSGVRRPAANLRIKVRQATRFDGPVDGIDLPDV